MLAHLFLVRCDLWGQCSPIRDSTGQSPGRNFATKLLKLPSWNRRMLRERLRRCARNKHAHIHTCKHTCLCLCPEAYVALADLLFILKHVLTRCAAYTFASLSACIKSSGCGLTEPSYLSKLSNSGSSFWYTSSRTCSKNVRMWALKEHQQACSFLPVFRAASLRIVVILTAKAQAQEEEVLGFQLNKHIKFAFGSET